MTDPRFTDDPRLSDPVIRRDENVGGMWSWVAGVALLLLIGFMIVAGYNHNSNPASSGSYSTDAPHRDTAEHHGLRLVIAAADHPGAVYPGAIEERYAVTRQLFHETTVPGAVKAPGTTANSG